jgi:hypothetical protein
LTGAIMVANSPTGIQSGPHRWHFDLNISPWISAAIFLAPAQLASLLLHHCAHDCKPWKSWKPWKLPHNPARLARPMGVCYWGRSCWLFTVYQHCRVGRASVGQTSGKGLLNKLWSNIVYTCMTTYIIELCTHMNSDCFNYVMFFSPLRRFQ